MAISKTRRGTLAVCLLAAMGALATAVWAHQLWQVQDWRTPLNWQEGGDALFNVLLAQSIEETGWYQENPRLGAPGRMELYDWPGAILVPMTVFKVLGITIRAPGTIVNAYYLLGWPLAAIAAAWALLRLGIRPPLAAGLAVVFAALPAHALRGEPHLFLATLALVPPALVVALVLAGRGLTARGRVWALSFAFLLGASDAYYGFFASALVATGGVLGWWTHAARRRLVDAISFGLASAAGLAVAILPTLIYGDRSIVARPEAEAGILGLKLGQMLLPVSGHRFAPLAHLADRYITAGSAPGLATESMTSALGLLATLGFLMLMAWLLGARIPATDSETMTALARLSLVAVLFATVGGFGSLFVTFVSPQIRAYNRMSVFIGFLALAALGLVLDAFLARTRSGERPAAAWSVAAALAIFGAWDQSSILGIPRHVQNTSAWTIDRDWVGRAEAVLPQGAMVFTLPWVPFPESPPEQRMFNYDWLRPVLVSHSVHWSYGAMKNSAADQWQRMEISLPVREMLASLRAKGFAAVVVDRRGYPERGAEIVGQLSALLGMPAVESSNHRWLMFPLGPAEQGAARPGS